MRSASATRDVAIMILSQYVEAGIATRLLAEVPERLGYLLKDRVTASREFVDALGASSRAARRSTRRSSPACWAAAHARTAAERLTRPRARGPRAGRRGLTNQAIATRLDIALRSVEKHVSTIFTKLGLPDTGSEHRRVLAVLRFLRP